MYTNFQISKSHNQIERIRHSTEIANLTGTTLTSVKHYNTHLYDYA